MYILHDNTLALSTDVKYNVAQMMEFVFERVKNNGKKGQSDPCFTLPGTYVD